MALRKVEIYIMISDSGPAGQCLKLAGAFPLVFLCLVLVNQRD
jgi:hypothetical protein